MKGIRWSDEEVTRYLGLMRGSGVVAAVPIARARAPAPARESPLEAELAGHLAVMGLKPERQYRFHPERRWRFDFAFPDQRVVIDVDGGVFAAENAETAGRHARGKGICAGFEKRNAAAELGYCVLCYGPPQIRSGEAALQIERVLTLRIPHALEPRAAPG